MQNLTMQQQQAAETARAQLAEQQKQYAEQRAEMAKQQEAQAKALEEDRRKMAQRESSRLTAARRSGRRALLSEARLSPETGLATAMGNGYNEVTRSA